MMSIFNLKKIVIITFCLAILLLSGCDENGCFGSVKECSEVIDREESRGLLRREIFNDCMAMSAKIKVKDNSSISSIISECDNVALYMSNQIL